MRYKRAIDAITNGRTARKRANTAWMGIASHAKKMNGPLVTYKIGEPHPDAPKQEERLPAIS